MGKLTLDNGARSEGGLALAFSRGQATFDPTDAPVAADEPRFDEPGFYLPAPVQWRQVFDGTGGVDLRLLAAGRDHDGDDLVAAWTSGGAIDFRTFKGDHPDNLTVTVDRDITRPEGGFDILAGLGNQKPRIQHRPAGALEILPNGAMILWAEMFWDELDDDNFKTWGVACLISEDLGATWRIVPPVDNAWSEDSDYPDPTNPNKGGHIAGWASSYNPFDNVWGGTDYQSGSGDTNGGAIWIMDSGTLAHDGTRAVANSKMREVFRRTPYSAAGNNHIHSVAVGKTPTGYWFKGVVGDGTQRAWILGFVEGDLETGTVTVFEDANGAGTTPDINDSDFDTEQPTKPIYLPSGDVGWASDNDGHMITITRRPKIGDTKITGYAARGANTTEPGDNGPLALQATQYVGQGVQRYWTKRSGNGGSFNNQPDSWADYDAVSANGRDWAVAGPRTSGIVALTKDWMYRVAADGESMEAAAWQDPVQIRPLVVNPAGDSIMPDLSGQTPNANGAQLDHLTPDADGLYRWPAGYVLAGDVIDPQPRGDHVQVMAVRTTEAVDGTVMLQTLSASDIPDADWHSVEYDAIPAPGVNALNGGAALRARLQSWNAPDRRRSLAPVLRQIAIDQNDAGTTESMQIRWQLNNLLASEFVVYWNQWSHGLFPSYPVAHGSTGNPQEKADVQRLALPGGDWAVAMRLTNPRSLHGHGFEDGEKVLLTLWGDASNYLTLSFGGGTQTTVGDLILRVTQGGSETHSLTLTEAFHPVVHSQLWVVIAVQDQTAILEATHTMHPAMARGTVALTNPFTPTPDQVRLRNPSDVVECPIGLADVAPGSSPQAAMGALLAHPPRLVAQRRRLGHLAHL